MPCDSSYMKPNVAEKQKRQAAKLLAWAMEQLGQAVPAWVKAVASDYYGEGGEHAMADLCELLGRLENGDPFQKKEFERVVYDAKNSTSRRLADWWENHKEQDLRKPDGTS